MRRKFNRILPAKFRYFNNCAIKFDVKYIFDDSDSFLHYMDKFQNDSITLVYLANYLSKRYTLRRSKFLSQCTLNELNYSIILPSLEVLPRVIETYKIQSCGVVELNNVINLKSSTLLPSAWKKSRIKDAIEFVGTETNLWRFDPNHRTQFFFPMCYSIVYSGNHSITSGILKELSAECINGSYVDFSEAYKTIKYSKGYFYSPQGKIKLHPNERIIGVLFEIGRLIKKSGFTFSDYILKYQQCYTPLETYLSKEFSELQQECMAFIK